MRTRFHGETHDPSPSQATSPTIPAIPPTDVLRRLAALQTAPTADLKQQWRELFGKEPPPFSRPYLQSRLAYRIQELAYGGLKPETAARLEALGRKARRRQHRAPPHPGRRPADRRHPADPRVPGRRARRDGAAPMASSTRAALSIALGHRPRHHRHALEWLDLLRPARARWRMSRRKRSRRPVDLAGRPSRSAAAPSTPASQHRRGTGAGIQLASMPSATPARPTWPASGPRAGCCSPDRYDDGGFSGGTLERPALRRLLAGHRGRPHRRGRGLQDRPAQPLADGLRQAGRDVRPARRHLRVGHAIASTRRPAWAG